MGNQRDQNLSITGPYPEWVAAPRHPKMIMTSGIPERGGVVNSLFPALFRSGWMAEGMR